jgi:hypothetical protein
MWRSGTTAEETAMRKKTLAAIYPVEILREEFFFIHRPLH